VRFHIRLREMGEEMGYRSNINVRIYQSESESESESERERDMKLLDEFKRKNQNSMIFDPVLRNEHQGNCSDEASQSK
jgi:hypothetical protein